MGWTGLWELPTARAKTQSQYPFPHARFIRECGGMGPGLLLPLGRPAPISNQAPLCGPAFSQSLQGGLGSQCWQITYKEVPVGMDRGL